jgi:hypothetical protein
LKKPEESKNGENKRGESKRGESKRGEMKRQESNKREKRMKKGRLSKRQVWSQIKVRFSSLLNPSRKALDATFHANSCIVPPVTAGRQLTSIVCVMRRAQQW